MGHAINGEKYRWPSGIVPYTINPEVAHKRAIYQAMNEWERISNLRFVERTIQEDYIHFTLDTLLFSTSRSSGIGKEGGVQYIYLNIEEFSATPEVGNASGRNTIMHEIGHAIGLKHEHQRSDRDEYVEVNISNVIEDRRGDFKKMPSGYLKTESYDYASIMHYGSYSSAIDTSVPTIEPLDSAIPLNLLGSSTIPTDTDLEMVEILYPNAGVIRRSSSEHGAGEVREISCVAFGNGNFISAVKNGSNNLALIRWRIDHLGGVRRFRYDATAGTASHIAVCMSGDNCVTALRDGSGRLTLISWSLAESKIERLHDIRIAKADLIRVLTLSEGLVLTASRNGSGDLMLHTWSVLADGTFAQLSDSGTQAGEVSEISLCFLNMNGTQHVVSTTVRAGNGKVKVITWSINAAGTTINRRGDSDTQIGAGSLIETTKFGRYLIVSCRTASDNLKLISLTTTTNGNTITRVADSANQAGKIGLNALSVTSYGALSAVRNASGNLVMIKWRIGRSGTFQRIGDSSDQAGKVSLIELASIARNTAAPDIAPPFVTFVRDGSGDMKLISWDDQAENGELFR